MKIVIGVVGFLVLSAIVGLIWFFMCWKFVDNYEIGYKFNATSGETTVLARTGWNPKRPFLDKINTVDTRPMQVCINANSRVLNCKLVKFNPAGLALFLSWHGRQDYTQVNLEEILKSYAYDGSGRNYPFLTVLRELKNEEAPTELEPVIIQAPAPTLTPAPETK
ncbi:MAG: hypothetical protein KBC16_01870 [Candidatus Pacebacteria bacterium]|nr:hypothetical protein [Candidatus Paceibacterota bacterium]